MLEPGSELGGYRIERELGRGGMGVVYEATQLRLARTVALKVLSAELGADAEFRERFRREGLSQAAIDHPHVITVYEAGESGSYLFIAMRLVHGPTLKDLIRSGELPRERALDLLRQVADALDAAHRAGLVHRDVKPQNILVGAGDHGYLADFGITKALAETGLTVTGQFMGTPHYIAPEQVNGQRVSAASDIYALAAVAYESLTGTVPFQRDTNQAVLFAHVFDPPPRASEVAPGLPPAVDAALARGMAKEPKDRPPTAGALLVEVTSAIGGEPVAPTPSVPARAGPPAMRAAAATPGADTEAPGPAQRESRAEIHSDGSVVVPGPRRLPRAWVAVVGAVALIAAAVATVLLLAGGDGDGGRDGAGGGREPTRVSHAAGIVTLGSALDNPDHTGATCFGEPTPTAPCTLAETALRDRTVVAGFDGIVALWRVIGATGRIELVILRGRLNRRGTSRLARVARSAEMKVPDTGLQSFPTRLRVKKGDRIALQLTFGARLAGPYVGEGARIERWDPPLTERSARADPPQDGYELLYNADLEHDADGDGYGDSTQDDCPKDPQQHTGC